MWESLQRYLTGTVTGTTAIHSKSDSSSGSGRGTARVPGRIPKLWPLRPVPLAVPPAVVPVPWGTGSLGLVVPAGMYLVLKAVAVLPLSTPVLPVMLRTLVFSSFSQTLQLLPHDTHTNNRKPYQTISNYDLGLPISSGL